MKQTYLKKNRLADVIALIQVLALDERTHRSANGLKSELQGDPKSAKSWKQIAEAHPEFFRFNITRDEKGDDAHAISLLARHVLKKNEEGVRVFPTDFAKNLLEIAIKLHDKQKERADRWKVWLPFIAVILTVLATIYVNSGKKTDAVQEGDEAKREVRLLLGKDTFNVRILPAGPKTDSSR